jgi:hypothetical protein
MHEGGPSSPESSRFTITHERAIKDPEVRLQYQAGRVGQIRAGEQVFMIYGFGDPDRSFDFRRIVMGFYLDGESRGYIEGTAEAFIDGATLDGFQIYDFIPDEDDPERKVPHHLNPEPIENLSEAKKRLRDAILETDLD